MKIKYSVWMSDHENHNVERTIDTYDMSGILRAFEEVLDLRELRAENVALKRVSLKLEQDKIPIVFPKRDTAPHNPFRVYEYDGAFWCLDCQTQWGALPGRPIMPAVCDPAADVSKL